MSFLWRSVHSGLRVRALARRLTGQLRPVLGGPARCANTERALDPNPPLKGKDPMSERSEPRVTPLRLVLEFGETVELDGSTLYDPTSETAVPAAVLRMPPHRAAYIGEVLDAYTRVSRLAGTEVTADERGPAWALRRTASAAGFVDPGSAPISSRVTSARRMAAAGVLRAKEDFDNTTMIAVVDAAARWLDEPEGEEYAYALLGAVTDGPTQLRTYGQLLGTGSAANDG
jgi:hypothetical protein